MSKKQHKLRVLKSNDLFDKSILVLCLESSGTLIYLRPGQKYIEPTKESEPQIIENINQLNLF